MVGPPLADPLVFLNTDMDQTEVFRFASGWAAIISKRSPISQSLNEDSAALIPYGPDGGVLVVADGMGGGKAGDQASKAAIRAVKKVLHEERANKLDLRHAILNAFESANQAVLKLGLGAGTTLAMAEIGAGTVRPYHVGDSSVLAIGKRGKIKLQTMAHSPTGYAVESGLIEQAEAIHHCERHLVSNVVGSPDMRIEVGPTREISPNDTVILASDGLFDNLDIDEIVDLSRNGELPIVVNALTESCLDRMTNPKANKPSNPDDLTIVSFRYGGAEVEG